MQKVVPWAVALVAIFAWAMWNKSAEAKRGYSDCIKQEMFSSDLHTRCSCLSSEVADELPFSYYLPIVGPIFFKPGAADQTAIVRGNLNQCNR